jgi:peptidoglycan glycosyltransferase
VSGSSKVVGALVAGSLLVVAAGVMLVDACPLTVAPGPVAREIGSSTEVPVEGIEASAGTGTGLAALVAELEAPIGDEPPGDWALAVAGEGSGASALGGAGGEAAEIPEPAPEPEPPLGRPAEDPRPEAAFGFDFGSRVLDETLGRYTVTLDSGEVLVLTLIPALQDELQSLVERYDEPMEAVVAIEAETGRVLALVEDGNSARVAEHPALSAIPYAASLFKTVTAAALLSDGGLDPTSEECVARGRSSVDAEDLTPDPARDTRCVDLTGAMAGSVNVYFARHSEDIAPHVFQGWINRFGFNSEIPLEIPVEVSAAEVPGDRLERGRMAAGFRHSHLSPLHAALMAAVVANDGVMMAPTLVEEVRDASGVVTYSHRPVVWATVTTPEVAQQLQESLSETTTTGTAARYFREREGWPADLHVDGKTGTLSNRSGVEGVPDPDPYLMYSWFNGYASFGDSTLAVGALVAQTERWYIKGSYLAAEAFLRYRRIRAAP